MDEREIAYQRNSNGSEYDTPAFVGGVVVIPRAEEDGRRTSAPTHHEAREIRNRLPLQHINCSINNKSRKRQQETQHDKRASSSREIRRKSEDEQHHGTAHIGRDGIQIRLDLGVAQPADDLREEERDGLQGDAETDFDGEEGVGGGLAEDLEGVAKVERLVYNRGGINLDAVIGKLFLVVIEEFGGGGGLGEVEEGEDSEADCAETFDEEEVAPVFQGGVGDAEDADGALE